MDGDYSQSGKDIFLTMANGQLDYCLYSKSFGHVGSKYVKELGLGMGRNGVDSVY